jgi:drug/metabolite transporter (DMT)-like permease
VTNPIPLSYTLVLLATVSHAYWNFLLKRAGGGQRFVGLSKIAEVIMFAPVFAILGWNEATAHLSLLLPLIVVGAGLTLLNYVMLGVAYQRADLTYVYPISRGAILLFVPALGYLVFGEHLDARGWIAIVMILGGIGVLSLTELTLTEGRLLLRRMWTNAGTGFALLAAGAAAGYTIWDKRAVGFFQPFTYFYAYGVIVALAYGVYLFRVHGTPALRAELAVHAWPIAQVGFLNTVTYVLVLFALRSGVSSYVIAIRQLSIAFGALLGWRLLGEQFGAPRRIGVALIVVGTMLVALGR